MSPQLQALGQGSLSMQDKLVVAVHCEIVLSSWYPLALYLWYCMRQYSTVSQFCNIICGHRSLTTPILSYLSYSVPGLLANSFYSWRAKVPEADCSCYSHLSMLSIYKFSLGQLTVIARFFSLCRVDISYRGSPVYYI